jgi:hypothetical protein
LASAASQLVNQEVPARPRRWPVLAVGAAVVAAVVGLISWQQRSRNEPAVVEPASVPPAAPQEAAPPPTPDALPPEVLLTIDSEPQGADIYRAADGVRIGATPHTVRALRGRGNAVFILRKRGFRPGELVLPVTADRGERLVLEKEGRPPKPKPDRPSPSPSPPNPSPRKPIPDAVVDPY